MSERDGHRAGTQEPRTKFGGGVMRSALPDDLRARGDALSIEAAEAMEHHYEAISSLRVIWWEKHLGEVGVSVKYKDGGFAMWVVPNDLELSGRSDAITAVTEEIAKATAKFPTWPTDPLHALAVLGEECGELTKDVLQFVYEPHKTTREKIAREAVQTAAMALRFIASLDVYEYTRCEQHEQRLVAGNSEAK